jgi:sugar O-acyltransferase (sialic acid O-acetyltransferase NeuD family)
MKVNSIQDNEIKNIVIVGAGGFGREVLQWIKDINKKRQTYNILGFIDDNLQALEDYQCDYNILGTIEGWEPSSKEAFVMAIASPLIKQRISSLLKKKGASFISIMHPTAIVGDFVKLGEGVVLYPNTIITTNVRIGDFVTVLSSNIGHDVSIGDYSTISSFCDITGGVIVGKKVFLGSHSTIVPKKHIGDNAYIGAGSVVISNIKKNIKVFGNPARKLNV